MLKEQFRAQSILRTKADKALSAGILSHWLTRLSADPERNPFDDLAAEAVLQTFEDFFALVADDLAQPDAAVHVHKERAFGESHRLRVRDDVRINQVVPDLHDLGVAATLLHAETGQHLRHEIAHATGADLLRDLQRRHIHATPLREDALLGTALQAARAGTGFGWG